MFYICPRKLNYKTERSGAYFKPTSDVIRYSTHAHHQSSLLSRSFAKKKDMKIMFACIFCCITVLCNAQQGIAINEDGSAPSPSAILDIKSTNKGMLVPRLSQDQKNGIVTPANGLLVFQTCLLYTSPSPRDAHESRMPSSA